MTGRTCDLDGPWQANECIHQNWVVPGGLVTVGLARPPPSPPGRRGLHRDGVRGRGARNGLRGQVPWKTGGLGPRTPRGPGPGWWGLGPGTPRGRAPGDGVWAPVECCLSDGPASTWCKAGPRVDWAGHVGGGPWVLGRYAMRDVTGDPPR